MRYSPLETTFVQLRRSLPSWWVHVRWTDGLKADEDPTREPFDADIDKKLDALDADIDRADHNTLLMHYNAKFLKYRLKSTWKSKYQ